MNKEKKYKIVCLIILVLVIATIVIYKKNKSNEEYDKKLDRIVVQLRTEQLVSAVQMHCDITINKDNTVNISNIKFDKTKLDIALYLYKLWKNPDSNLKSDEIIAEMNSKDIKINSSKLYKKINDYVDWYHTKASEEINYFWIKLDKLHYNTKYATIPISKLTIEQIMEIISDNPEVIERE